MVRKRPKKRFYNSASVPAEDYDIIKEWLNRGESPFGSCLQGSTPHQNSLKQPQRISLKRSILFNYLFDYISFNFTDILFAYDKLRRIIYLSKLC